MPNYTSFFTFVNSFLASHQFCCLISSDYVTEWYRYGYISFKIPNIDVISVLNSQATTN